MQSRQIYVMPPMLARKTFLGDVYSIKVFTFYFYTHCIVKTTFTELGWVKCDNNIFLSIIYFGGRNQHMIWKYLQI